MDANTPISCRRFWTDWPWNTNLFRSRALLEAYQGTVGGDSKQIPQYFPVKEGHEGGEFVFLPRL